MKQTFIPQKGQHAIVLGGGIAGLVSAIVLARHFKEVTILERDSYPSDPSAVRLHTPHGAHVHGILAAGLVTLFRLIPDLPAGFEEMGIQEGDLTHHVRIAYEGRWLPRARSGIRLRVCTRSDVEHLIKREVMRTSNVRLIDRCKIEGLEAEHQAGSVYVRGVRLERDGTQEKVSGDLVIDAMGRGSCMKQWLEKLFIPSVPELTVDAGIVYASAWFQAMAEISDDWSVLWTLPSIPQDARMGVVLRFAQSRMHCSLIGYGKPKAPRTHEEFVAQMAELCVPTLHRLLRTSRPMSDISIYGNTQNRWRKYGSLPKFAEGLVILGDSACSLNPRYGQGMTVATLGADLLNRELSAYFAARGDLCGFGHHFQKCLDRMLVVPWQIALMEDRVWLYSQADTPLSLSQRLIVSGSQRILKAAFSDIQTYTRFMRVAQLLDSPTKMLNPRAIAKIVLHSGRSVGLDDPPSIGVV